jgi:hypothetical protein
MPPTDNSIATSYGKSWKTADVTQGNGPGATAAGVGGAMTLCEQMMCILIIAILMGLTVALGTQAGSYVKQSTEGYVDKLDTITRPG